jgi:iron complex outermembrane receptor protein
VNAGDAIQKGIELSAELNIPFPSGDFFDRMWIRAGWAYSHYRYGSFVKDTFDFSGKKLPSVPEHAITSIMNLQMNNGAFVNVTYYHASRIYLNDANTASAEPYTLIGGKIGWVKGFKKIAIKLYVGADNLLDEVYSLGNDINDARGRYYNTAAGRNYFAGMQLTLPARR